MAGALNILDNFERLEVLNEIRIGRHRIRDRSNPLEDYNDIEFLRRLRFSKEGVPLIFEHIQAFFDLRCVDQQQHLPPILQLTTAPRYYATGSTQLAVSDLGGIHQSKVSRIIKRISRAIARQKQDFISFPLIHEFRQVQYGFYNIAQFPRVIGAIDCIHVPIKSPWGDDAELFRNRKGWHSINVQVIGDSQLLIRNIVARWSGSTHDSRIFDNCHQKVELEQNPMFQRRDSQSRWWLPL